MTVCIEKGIIGFVIDVDSYFADNVIVGGDGRFFGTTAVADKLVAIPLLHRFHELIGIHTFVITLSTRAEAVANVQLKRNSLFLRLFGGN